MNEVKNLIRYWADKDSGFIMREWTDEEYKSVDPCVHIFEKYWSYRCPVCGFIPLPTLDKEETRRSQIRHVNCFSCDKNRKAHKGFVEYRDHELACFETKDELDETLGVWICKQICY
jgi:hypothetical protein